VPHAAHLSESERKKALSKLKKAEAKAKAAKDAEPKKEADKGKAGSTPGKLADDDPEGLKLLQVPRPILKTQAGLPRARAH
jgi:N-alpha-acetyltransferase 15/16, NatA auxiliary subunit